MTTNTTTRAPGFDARALYDIYRVKLAIRDRLCGGVPKNKDLIKNWVAATTGFNDAQTEVQTQEHLDAMTADVAEKSWNGFPSDERGLYLYARQVKALFKECATMLRLTTDRRGSKQILQHGFEVKSLDGRDRVHLGREKPDGDTEQPIHVQTPQGPRTALKRVDYVEGASVEFEVWVLATEHGETRHVGEDEIRAMLTFGQENGLGADRSQGSGKFDVVDFEVVQKAKAARAVQKAEPAPAAKKPAAKAKANGAPAVDAD